LFECDDGKRHLHCGDMRFSKDMLQYPQLQGGGLDR
jgi:hypothetical protein